MLEFNKMLEDFEYPDAKTIEYKEDSLFIKQYLPTQDKYGVIYICLMSLDLENQPLNPLLAELLFDLEVVKHYTNINFENISESHFKQYDVLQIKGLIDLTIENIPKEEYEELSRLYEEAIDAKIEHNSNIGNAIGNLFSQLPNLEEELGELKSTNLDDEMKILDSLPDKMQKSVEIIEKMSENNDI